MKKWLGAFALLEQRLGGLRGRKQFSYEHLGDIWVFTDPSDGQKLIGLAGRGQPENIRETPEWKKLQAIKRWGEVMAKSGAIEHRQVDQLFRLYDDGWRVVKKP